ncbi:MAG TPA: hypothetical protein VM686_14950 [Polyangiaceae bacterium]|nr:hypothetical protein [Polyangiaceae bacterium]
MLSLSWIVTASAQDAQDVVLLVDGSELRGTVLQQEPGKFVVIRTADGKTHTLSWADIRRVETSAAPAPQPTPAAPAAAPPAPAAPPATSPQGTATTTTTTANVDSGGPKATFNQTQDCSTNPNQEICRRETTVNAGPDGLKAGFVQETVTKVGTPPTNSMGFSIDGGFLYGTTTGDSDIDVSIYGGGAMVGFRAQFGLGPFPGAAGGGWTGVTVHPTAGFYGAGVVYQIGDSTDGAGLTTLNIGTNVGFEYLSFGAMNPATLEQKGWGVFGGYRVGWAQSKVMSAQTVTDDDFSHGPVLSLLFPKYNAGTSHVEKGYVTMLLLPTGDFLFFTLSGGYQF